MLYRLLKIALLSCGIAIFSWGVSCANNYLFASPGQLAQGRYGMWGAEASKCIARKNRIIDALINLARDKTRSPADRRHAITLLSKIRDKKSLAFLIAHIGMELPPTEFFLSADSLHGIPCFAALRSSGSLGDDGLVGTVVLESLDCPKHKEDIRKLAELFWVAVGQDPALLVIREELSGPLNPNRRENLEKMLEYLQERLPK